MSIALIIRDFNPADLDAVLALNIRAQRPDADLEGSLRFYPALQAIPAEFQAAGAFVVGTVDGKVVAMGSIAPSPAGSDIFEMDYLRVAVPFQRRGFGRAVVRHLLERAGDLGAREVFLTVERSNMNARSLYESEGFGSPTEVTVQDIDGRTWHTLEYRKIL